MGGTASNHQLFENKRFFPALLFLIAVATIAALCFGHPSLAAAQAWDGVSVSEPAVSGGTYQIKTPNELLWFSRAVNSGGEYAAANAVLLADIDLNSKAWAPIGVWDTNSQYKGRFDGRGYRVIGLYINTDQAFQGLFGYTNKDAEIVNLRVKGSVTGGDSTGLIIGYNRGAVTNCVAEGPVTGGINVGGIAGCNGNIGANLKAAIVNCLSLCDVVSTTTANTGDTGYAGGIVGYNINGALISGCTASGSVTGQNFIGGIAGWNKGTAGAASVIKNCAANCTSIRATWSSDNPYQKTYVGGIAGSNESKGSITNCGWLKTAAAEAAGVDSAGTKENVTSFDQTTVDNGYIAATCLPEPSRIALSDVASGEIELTTYPSNTAASAYITITSAAATPAALGTVSVNGAKVAVTAGDEAGQGAVSIAFMLSPTLFTGNCQEMSQETIQLSADVALTVTAKPSITTSSLADASVGALYSQQLAAAGSAPITWSASGLPAGLALASETGLISGAPEKAGSSSVEITASNAAGSATKSYTLVVAASGAGPITSADYKPQSSVEVSCVIPAGVTAVTVSPGGTAAVGQLAECDFGSVDGLTDPENGWILTSFVMKQERDEAASGDLTLTVKLGDPIVIPEGTELYAFLLGNGNGKSSALPAKYDAQTQAATDGEKYTAFPAKYDAQKQTVTFTITGFQNFPAESNILMAAVRGATPAPAGGSSSGGCTSGTFPLLILIPSAAWSLRRTCKRQHRNN